ncbi:MAG: hypothetical protein WDA18_06000 [Candidatus Ratteibacteria bacterium]|jgi:hypothetical protein
MQNLRVASWWFRWEEFNYPDTNIEKKLQKRAENFSEAGITLALIFGFHCRWDYIYCFDRVHELIRFSREVCHHYQIQLFDHFSAPGIHRPRTMEGKWKLYHEGRNRMTFHPSLEMAESLSWRSSRLNDWRMIRIQSNEPAFYEGYQFEMFCINNPDFRKASGEYLKQLQDETQIDGLMFDDGLFYPGWDSCGCIYCREGFKKKSGEDLPDWKDISFWGNYDNPLFRAWVRFRCESAAEFLMIPRTVLGEDFPLTACSSSGPSKSAESSGGSIVHIGQYLNHIMLEMCGDITCGRSGAGLRYRVPNLLLNRAVAAERRAPCFGLGFAFYPDSAFLVWALNKFFGTGCWISAGKGRVNVAADEMGNLPNEEDIVKEAYCYEQAHPELFQGKPLSSLAIFYSSDTKINRGDLPGDYEESFRNLTTHCFEENIPASVITTLKEARNYPVIAMADIACLSENEQKILLSYLEEGGTIIASGPLGTHNSHGDPLLKRFLAAFGLKCHTIEPNRSIDIHTFFIPGKWPSRSIPVPSTVKVSSPLTPQDGWYKFSVGKGLLLWSPRRLNNPESLPAFLQKVKTLLPDQLSVEVPSNFRWNPFINGDTVIIHFLNCAFEKVPHPFYTYRNEEITHSIQYHKPKGTIVIRGIWNNATLFSPDLSQPRQIPARNKIITISLDGILRFCTVTLPTPH